MNTRTALALLTSAALTAAAQAQPDEFIVTWEVNAFDIVTGDIVAANVSHLQPGQGAEFIASWSFTPPIGTIRTNHNNLTGPVDGIAKVLGDFSASPGHRGTFSPATAIAAHAQFLFHPGDVGPDGVAAIQQAVLSPLPMGSWYPHNSMSDAFRIRWTPGDWEPRLVNFHFDRAALADFGAELYIQTATQPFYTFGTYRIQNEHFHGGSVQLSIIPAPAGIAVLGLGALLAGRRRR